MSKCPIFTSRTFFFALILQRVCSKSGRNATNETKAIINAQKRKYEGTGAGQDAASRMKE